MARVYETATVLCLLGTLVLGMTYVLSSLLDDQNSSLHTLLSKYIHRSNTRILRRHKIQLRICVDLIESNLYRFMELLFTFPVLLRLVRWCSDVIM